MNSSNAYHTDTICLQNHFGPSPATQTQEAKLILENRNLNLTTMIL